jgi:hypothetical protein
VASCGLLPCYDNSVDEITHLSLICLSQHRHTSEKHTPMTNWRYKIVMQDCIALQHQSALHAPTPPCACTGIPHQVVLEARRAEGESGMGLWAPNKAEELICCE